MGANRNLDDPVGALPLLGAQLREGARANRPACSEEVGSDQRCRCRSVGFSKAKPPPPSGAPDLQGIRSGGRSSGVGSRNGISDPLMDSSDLLASGSLSPDIVKISCLLLGLFFGYTLPKVAENYIVVGGPPIAIVLGYEYLVYEGE